MTSWYEMRVDGARVAAFGDPITTKALEQVFDLVDKTRLGLYRGKVLQIVAKGSDGWEELIHEEHPTVWED